MTINRRTLIGGLAAFPVASAPVSNAFARANDLPGPAVPPVTLLPSEQPRSVLMWIDTVPAWRGPGLYEVEYVDGPRIVFIEPEPIHPESNDIWFRASEGIADRERRGSWSMPSASLALMTIRKVGDIAPPLEPSEPLAPQERVAWAQYELIAATKALHPDISDWRIIRPHDRPGRKQARRHVHDRRPSGQEGGSGMSAIVKLPDIDLAELFREGAPAIDAGVIFLAVTAGDRLSLATTIERLINLLDALDGDPDIEAGCDDEDVNEDGREDSLDAGATEHGIADDGWRAFWSFPGEVSA